MWKKAGWIFIYALIIFLLTEAVLRLPGIKAPVRLYEGIEDPDIRWVHTPGFEGKWGRTEYIRINSQGFREDREYPFDKPQDTFRIFAVGECLIVGDSVVLKDSFVKQLEDMLNKRKPFSGYKNYEVINGGHTQYDEMQKVSFLKKYGLKYHPDLIIFSHDISSKFWLEARARLRPVSLALSKLPKNIRSVRYLVFGFENIVEWGWNVFVISMRTMLFPDWSADRYAGKGLDNLKIPPALKDLAALSRESHVPVLVILTPWLENLEEDKYAFQGVHKFYTEECEKNGLALLDLYGSYFKNKQAPLFWIKADNRRPNALSNKIIAEVVYQELIKR